MTTLDDVYRKFGETAEFAQLLETELGSLLLLFGIVEERLADEPNPKRALEILNDINRRTLGQLLRTLGGRLGSLDEIAAILADALRERNRLFHSFYRQHNLRRNSPDGREIMLQDLSQMHGSLMTAYKAVMLLSGVNLDDLPPCAPPTGHLPI